MHKQLSAISTWLCDERVAEQSQLVPSLAVCICASLPALCALHLEQICSVMYFPHKPLLLEIINSNGPAHGRSYTDVTLS